MNRIIRGLVALVLVCVLVVSWSPIRARAVPVVGWDGFAWNLSEIIASGAIGIGTSPGAVPDDWNNMIENAKQACQDFFGFVGDTMKIYRFFDGSSYKYYAKADFVEWLRGWMWRDAYLTSSSGNTIAVSGSIWGDCTISANNQFWVCGFARGSRTYTMIVSSSDQFFSVDCSDGNKYTHQCSNSHNGLHYFSNWGPCDASSPSYPFYGDFTSYSVSGASNYILDNYFPGLGVISTSYDINLAHVGLPELTLGDSYPDWIVNSMTIPSGTIAELEEDTVVYPLGLGQTLEETQGLTQEQIWAGESTLEVEIEEALEGTVSGTTWADFTTWFGQKLEWIPKQILEGITAIFVPKEDFLTAKWEAIRAEFAFADSIMTSGDMILGVLNGLDPEPPVIYIDLGASEGSYDIGGEVPFLDLRWYERYKPTGDAIISAFLWLVFVWRMFIKLPGIIGGLPGDFVMQGVVNLGLSEHLPARKKEYEYERQQNRRSMKK